MRPQWSAEKFTDWQGGRCEGVTQFPASHKVSVCCDEVIKLRPLDQDLILWATEIKVRAERKAGELLRDSAARGERFPAGGPRAKQVESHAETRPATLEEIGISNTQSSRWQQLASMSEDHFEAAVATAKESAGQVTTAFMLREAAKANKAPHRCTTGGCTDWGLP